MSMIKSKVPECPVCFAEYEDISREKPNIPEKDRKLTMGFPCGHTMCKSCFSNLTRDVCPICISPIDLNKIYTRNFQLEAALSHINVLTDKNWKCMLCCNTYSVEKMLFCMTCFRKGYSKTTDRKHKDILLSELPICQKCYQNDDRLEKHECWAFDEFYQTLKVKMGAVRVVETTKAIVHELVDEKISNFDYQLAKKIADVNLRAENAKKQKMMETALALAQKLVEQQKRKVQQQLQPSQPRPEQYLPMPQLPPLQLQGPVFFYSCWAPQQLNQAPAANALYGSPLPIQYVPMPANGRFPQHPQHHQ